MSVGETVLGGILAALAGAGTLWLDRRNARKDEAARLVDKQNATVLTAIMRIQQMHAWFKVIKRGIDECFDSADDPEGKMEPGLKVLPMIMPSIEPPPFSAEELALAFSTKDSGLVERLLNLSSNFHANVQVLKEFNSSRKEHTAFVQASAIQAKEWAGNHATVSLPNHTLHGHESRVAILNQLVATLIEDNDRGIEECKLVMSRLSTALKSLPGLSVPSVVF